MKATLLLSYRYLAFHRWRTIILVLCIALVFFLPVAVTALVGHFEERLGARAMQVPLLVGSKGSRYDLVLSSLYFRGHVAEALTQAETATLEASGLGLAVPVHTEHTAKGRPVIGTTLDYFGKLGLRVAEGSLPLRLGDAVVGSRVAEELSIHAGSRLITDVTKLYDISSSYPLRMRVTGVLAESGSPDDGAVFVDVKTAWVIDGIGHGHVEAVRADEAPDGILDRREGEVVFNDSIVKYVEITDGNIASFHFHGDLSDFPVTAILVWPVDAKARTILKARYGVSKTAQMLVPREVIEELMGFVFRIKRFFDANFVLVAVATALFLALIVLLTLRIRKREMETLFKIGCSRATVFRLQAVELAMVLAAGLVLAGLLSGATLLYVVRAHLLI